MWFFSDPRDIVLGFSTDSFGPFKKRNKTAWPLIIFNYNLPPKERFQKENIISLGTIPGPKKPANLIMATGPGAIDWCAGIWCNCTGKFFSFIFILSFSTELNIYIYIYRLLSYYMLIWLLFSVIFLPSQLSCAWRATMPFLHVVCATFKVFAFLLHQLRLIILLSTVTTSLV